MASPRPCWFFDMDIILVLISNLRSCSIEGQAKPNSLTSKAQHLCANHTCVLQSFTNHTFDRGQSSDEVGWDSKWVYTAFFRCRILLSPCPPHFPVPCRRCAAPPNTRPSSAFRRLRQLTIKVNQLEQCLCFQTSLKVNSH